MDDKIQKQAVDFLRNAQTVGVVVQSNANLDKVATAIALYRMLELQGKAVSLVSAMSLPEATSFLSGGIIPTTALGGTASLELVVSTKSAKLDQLSYQVEEDGMHIFLHPREGLFTHDDVQVQEISAPLDALVLVGVSTPEDLGVIYQQHADQFFNTPKIVFDTSPDNTYFGTVNVVDVTASSLGELVTDLLLSTEPGWVQGEVATALLAAITASTNSFQSVKTTPRTFALASDLVTAGAKQQEVVKHLYKTKPFPLLKLWGRALARAQFIESASLLYALLTASDFEKTETTPDFAEGVLQELLDNSTGAQVIALLAEAPKGVILVVAAMPHVSLAKLVESLGGTTLSTTTIRNLYIQHVIQLPLSDISQAEQQLLRAFQT